MRIRQNANLLAFLRWSLGVVVLWESFQFAVSSTAAHHLQRMGLPTWTAPALGGAEIIAAILFLIARLRRIGGYSLLAIFVIAAVLHIIHGQYEIGSLVVYSAAVLVCMSASETGRGEVVCER